MKNKILSILFCLIFFASHSNAQVWQWANGAGGNNNDRGVSICSDHLGYVYLAGTSEFPICYFQTDTLTINGFNDFFIAKYDLNGNEVWIKQFGGPYYNLTNIKIEGFSDMIFDSISNCIYVAGAFYDSCLFGTTTLHAGANDAEIFFAKFDLNGNCLWAVSGGGPGDDGGCKLTSDNIGNIFITGGVSSIGSFDTLTVDAGGFLAKYDSSGNIIWVKNISGIQMPGGYAKYQVVNIQYLNNNLYMLGANTDSLTIDTLSFTNTNYIAHILSCWNSSGNIKWANQFAGPLTYGYGSMSNDSYGNLYCIGNFSGSFAAFGTDTIYSTDPNSGYITRYDTSGTETWIKQITTSQNLDCLGNFSDNEGNNYLTGRFIGNTNFGGYNITSTSTEDIFIARYNADGDCIGVRHTGEGWGFDVISDASGSAYITGQFKNTINFDLNSLTSHGSYDMFIAKIDQFTGIDEGEERMSNTLNIYANPNAGKCNITIPDEFLREKRLTLNIYDNSGKLIQQKRIEMNEGKIKLNLEAQAKGVYHATLSNDKKSYSGKIVFE